MAMIKDFHQETTSRTTGISDARLYAARLLEYSPNDEATENIARAMTYMPPGALELLVRNETSIIVMSPGHYPTDVSPTLRSVVGVRGAHEFPNSTAGLYVSPEHRLFVGRHDHASTLVHEAGHALDHALLRQKQLLEPDRFPPGRTMRDGASVDDIMGVYYLSSLSENPRFASLDRGALEIDAAWREGEFVSPYAASARDEMFAESFRHYCDTGSPGNMGMLGSGRRSVLEARAPRLSALLAEAVDGLNSERVATLEREEVRTERIPEIITTAGLTPEAPAIEPTIEQPRGALPSIEAEPEAPARGGKRADLRTEITEKIVASLEKGVVPWSKPWTSAGSPHNAISNRPYHGGNRVYLGLLAMEREYTDPRWMTFNQAREKGWMVAKGEKGTRVEYWKPPERVASRDDNDGTQTPEGRDGEPSGESQKVQMTRWRVFTATVFNAHQVLAPLKNDAGEIVTEPHVGKDGTVTERPVMRPLPEVQPYGVKRDFVPIERAQEIMEAIGAKVFHDGGDRAFYRPSTDEIHLPTPESFRSAEDYYATRGHESIHWSLSKERLNFAGKRMERDGKTEGEYGRFGSELYALEELRAELGSVFLAQEIGISLPESHFQNHAAYIGHWAEALRESKNEIFSASRDAEQAVDYLLELAGNNLELARAKGLEQAQTPELDGAVEITDAASVSALPAFTERAEYLDAMQAHEENDVREKNAYLDKLDAQEREDANFQSERDAQEQRRVEDGILKSNEATRAVVSLNDVAQRLEAVVQERYDDISAFRHVPNRIAYEEATLTRVLDTLRDAGVTEVALPQGPLGVSNPVEALSFEDIRRVLGQAVEHEVVERSNALDALEVARVEAASLGIAARPPQAQPAPEYAASVGYSVKTLYEDLAFGVAPTQAIEPEASDLHDAIVKVTPSSLHEHPAVQGLASALHDVGVNRLSDEHVTYLAKATDEIIRAPIPEHVTREQAAAIQDRLDAYAQTPNTGNPPVLETDALVDHYIRSGAAALDRAQEIAWRDDASMTLGFEVVEHDVAFAVALADEFGHRPNFEDHERAQDFEPQHAEDAPDLEPAFDL